MGVNFNFVDCCKTVNYKENDFVTTGSGRTIPLRQWKLENAVERGWDWVPDPDSYDLNYNNNNIQEEKTMANFMKNMFGSIERGLCRLSADGSIAVKVGGSYKTYNAKDNALINCDNFVFDVGDEAFFVVPTNEAKVGDIILVEDGGGRRVPKYVIKADGNMLTVVNYINGAVETILPERYMFMGNTYMYGKIVSMFGDVSALTGGDGANNVMKYMMMSQMCKGMSGSDGGMNPMLMMMMMNGGGMSNIFNSMFGNITAPTVEKSADKED